MTPRALHFGPLTIADVGAPTAEDVHLPTIIARLSEMRRFNHHPDALTILAHCRLTKALAILDEAPWRVVQWAWRHDWHEAILGDIPAPVKLAIASRALDRIERAWDEAICEAEHVQPPDEWIRREVGRYDGMACRLEMEALDMTPDPALPGIPPTIDATEAWGYATLAGVEA